MQVSTKSPIIIASRGARFLDLVRQNKLNVSPQLEKRRHSISDAFTKELKERDEKLKNGGSNSEKENKEKDYLKFNSSLKIFDPNASPSSSILSKRKAESSSPLTSASGSAKVVEYFHPKVVNLIDF